MLINHDGRVVLSDFGVTANLERAAPSTLRINSHAEASTSDAAGAIPPCQSQAVNLQSQAGLCVHVCNGQRRMTERETSQIACL